MVFQPGGLGVVLTTAHCRGDDYEIFHDTSEFQNVELEIMDWVDLAVDRDRWQTLAVMKSNVCLSVLR